VTGLTAASNMSTRVTLADLDRFRADATAWLDENAPRFANPDRPVSMFHGQTSAERAEIVLRARAWEGHKAKEGWAGLDVPPQYGGQGRGPLAMVTFADLEGGRDLDTEIFAVTRGTVLPTLLSVGSHEQKATYVPGMLNGSALWCQLFSEPSAGSDLASIATRATRTTSGWRINGQKVWTSQGCEADYGYLLARSDPAADRYSALTAFIVDMHAPGVTARPIRQATGAAGFAEVFFDSVELTDDAVLGEPGGGWSTAITTLMHERLATPSGAVPWRQFRDFASEHPLSWPVAERAVRVYAQVTALKRIQWELLSQVAEGSRPGPEGSVSKLTTGRLQLELGRLTADVLAETGSSDHRWLDLLLGSHGYKIGGGTDEVLLDVIAERVLGLPRDRRGGKAQKGDTDGQH
jgi:alkylation response protein AidB-like acyl-CoA dehydrogenase